MRNRSFPAASLLTPLVSLLPGWLGGKRDSMDAAVVPMALPLTESRLSIAVQEESADHDACCATHARGQFLARQDRWDELAYEVRQADLTRATSPGGTPIADLLALGARSDVILALEHALADDRPANDAPVLNGINGLENMRRDFLRDPMIDLILALTHIDIAWIWRGTGTDADLPDRSRNRWAAHFDRAAELMKPLCAIELDSPAVAAAQCALLAGCRDPHTRVADDYEDLIDLDPHNFRHMRAFGVHMLPRWFGDYTALDLQARRTAARSRDVWGMGGYSWVCLDAIALDAQACALIDVDFLIDGLRDIVTLCPQQDIINLLAAWSTIAMRPHQGAPGPARQRIMDCANWLIRDHLTEIHPLIWAHASTGFDNNARITSPRRFAARGRAEAMQTIAGLFADDLSAGRRVTFTRQGPVTQSA